MTGAVQSPPVTVAIAGASGYAGMELLRLALGHPALQVVSVASRSQAGQPVDRALPHLAGRTPLVFEEEAGPADVLLLALPHGQSAPAVRRALEAGSRVVDLGADFRLRPAPLYQEWYGHPHPAPDLLEQAIYGLPELNRQALSQARLVANPGCYPTACILALLPLQGWVDPDSLICDCKSGVSGAGRPPSERNRYCEVEGSVIPYAAGGTHRHTPEIEQHLGWAWGRSLRVSFTPHLVPARRGILATAYARLVRRADTEEVLERMEQFYRGHPFVRVRPPGSLPATAEVAGSNYCDLGAVVDGRTGRLTVVSALDNLVKGAAGQALQNLNLMLGLEETTGLAQAPLFP